MRWKIGCLTVTLELSRRKVEGPLNYQYAAHFRVRGFGGSGSQSHRQLVSLPMARAMPEAVLSDRVLVLLAAVEVGSCATCT